MRSGSFILFPLAARSGKVTSKKGGNRRLRKHSGILILSRGNDVCLKNDYCFLWRRPSVGDVHGYSDLLLSLRAQSFFAPATAVGTQLKTSRARPCALVQKCSKQLVKVEAFQFQQTIMMAITWGYPIFRPAHNIVQPF